MFRGTIEKVVLGRVSEMLLSYILENHMFVSYLHLCSSQLTKNINFIYVKLKISYSLEWRNNEVRSFKRKKKI